jgi:hypothetical protein
MFFSFVSHRINGFINAWLLNRRGVLCSFTQQATWLCVVALGVGFRGIALMG